MGMGPIATRFLIGGMGIGPMATRFLIGGMGIGPMATRFILGGIGMGPMATRFSSELSIVVTSLSSTIICNRVLGAN